MAKKSSTPYILSLIAGILILIHGIVSVALIATVSNYLAAMLGSELAGVATSSGYLVGALGIILGLIVITGATIIKKEKKTKKAGIIVLIISIVSLIAGGGFVIGAVLGIIGGILAIRRK